MAKIIITAIVLLVVFAGLIVILDNVKVNQPTPTPTAVESASATPVPDFGTTGNIRVTSPKADDEIGLPLVIKGEARTFERAFAYRVIDENGKVLVEEHSMSSGKSDIGAFDPFEVSINYPVASGTKGSVEVFEYSAKDGSEINKVSIPVRFGAVPSQKVFVYFGNPKIDPQVSDCAKVNQVARRIAKTDTPVRSSLEELLKGTTTTDEKEGYTTSINDGVKVIGVSLENGVLKADFSKELGEGVAGSCKVTAIRSQIESTVKQFSSVKKVIISIEGKTEGILQP